MGDFSLSYVLNKFTESADTKGLVDVNLKTYCEAWIEIARFFDFINIGFGFVGNNVRSSCKELLESQQKSKNVSVTFLRDALNYDIQFGGVHLTFSSVIWLHRPLEFILRLFKDLSSLEDDDTPCSQIAIDNYLATMGRFHSWPVQQMVKLLFLTLPNWGDLRSITMKTEKEEVNDLMRKIIFVGQIVYDKTEKMLQEFDEFHFPDQLKNESILENEID